MKKQIFTLCVLAVFISGCMGGPSATQSVTKPQERTGGLFGTSTNADVTVDTPKAFAGVEEVVIGGFLVGFDIEKTESVKAGGGLLGSGFGGKSTARSKLTGVDQATMQAITDKAYKDFVSALEAKGYKILDRAKLTSSKEFADTNSLENPYENTQGGLLGGGNTTLYFAPSSFGGIKVFLGDIPGETGGFGFSNPSMGAAQYAEKNGIKVVHASFNVDFANVESYGGFHTKSSAINVGQGMSVVPEGTRLGIIGGEGGTFSTNIGSIALGQPVTSDKPFAEVTDATSDASKSVEVVTNVIGTLGGIGSNSSRNYEFKAKSADYQTVSLEVIQGTSDVLLEKMHSLK